MIHFRKFCILLAALMGLSQLGFSPALAFNPFVVGEIPGVSGDLLAGREAMRSLDTGAARQFFYDAVTADWEDPVLAQRAFEAMLADGRIDDAAQMAWHLIELDPENEFAHVVIATVALKERRYDSAITQLSNIADVSFVGITGSILHAWALVGNHAFDQSQQLLDQLLEGGLEEFLVFHRALMADVAGERELAIDLAEQAYLSQPYEYRYVEAYVRMLANAARFDDAKQILADYVEQGRSHPLVMAIADDVQEGRRPGKLASTVQAGAAEMFRSIGVALAQDGAVDTAILFLRLGHYLDEESDLIAMALAEVYENAQHYEVANALYDGISEDAALKNQAIVNTAANIDAMGDRQEAIRRLRNITVVQPENVDAFLELGNLLRYDERFAEAAIAYSKVIELADGSHPRDWPYFYFRGICYERSGQWPEAEADFLKALELNPGQPQVLNYLGYSWVDKGLHLDHALELIQQAIEWDPSDGYVVDSLGWAYYKLGRMDEAVQTLEQAVQLRPDDAEINDHLGDAYWRVGRKLEARFQWTIAIAVDDRGTVTERAENKLANGLDAETGE